MKVKKINEYSNEELNELLNFWFNYYQKEIYTLEELENFGSMVKTNPRSVLNTAIILHNNGLSATAILNGIRGNTEEIEESVLKWKKLNSFDMLKISNEFIKEIVESYNNHERSSISSEDFISQLANMFGSVEGVKVIDLKDFLQFQSSNSISIRELEKICMEVTFKEDEYIDGVPTSNFVKVKGLDKEFIYSAKGLNKNKDKIKELIDKLPSLTESRSFIELANTKDGYRWAITQEHVECLVTLGLACGYLTMSEVKDNIPYYKIKKDRVKRIVGESKKKFICFKNILEKEKQKELSRIEIVKSAFDHSTDETKMLLKLLGYEITFIDNSVFVHKLDEDIFLETTIEIKYNNVEIIAELEDLFISYSIRLDGLIGKDDLFINDRIRVSTINKEETEGEYFSIGIGNGDNDPRKAYGMEVDYFNPKEKQKHYVFGVSQNQVYVEIENEYNEDYNNNTRRCFHYKDPTKEKNLPMILLVAEEHHNKGYEVNIEKVDDTYIHSYVSNTTSNKLGNSKKSYKVSDDESARDLSLKYISTSRVKNLYNQVIAVIDGHLPGIKSLINENLPFSVYFEEVMKNEPEADFEEFMNKCKIKEANIPGEDEEQKKRRKM